MILAGLNPTSPFNSKRTSLQIRFQDVVYSVPGPKKGKQISILKSISGDFYPGELSAIMGGSGAGKSSLMNILAGFNKADFQGTVLINGVPRNLDEFRKMSCYIMQKDELCPHLSVTEAMELAASLKLGDTLSSHKKNSLIDEILDTIGMSHARKTTTSNLSGGERKRLSIALEMINNPPVMFFDEPTSGLDSSTCLQVVSLLRTLASGGRTIVCVIHQPSSSIFAMFDRVYLLTDGHCIYSGPTHSLVRYLSTSVDLVCPIDHNPADFAIEVATGRFGNLIDQLIEKNQQRFHSGEDFESSSTDLHYIINEATKSPPTNIMMNSDELMRTGCETSYDLDMISTPVLSVISGIPLIDDQNSDSYPAAAFNSNNSANFYSQFKLLLKRSVKCTLRDWTLTGVRLAVQIVTALCLICFVWNIGNEAAMIRDNINFLFMNQFVILFTALLTTILTFPLERSVLIKEHLNNWYTLKAYFFAKSAAEICFEIVHSTLYVVIVYFSSGQPFEVWRFFMYYSICLMHSCLAQSFGLAIGAVGFTIEGSAILGSCITGFFILFSGFLSVMSITPFYLRWIAYSSIMKYAFQGSLAVIYGFGRDKLHCSLPYCISRSPNSVLETYEVEESDFLVGLVVLVVYFILVRLLAYFLLRRDIRSKR